MTLMMPPAPPVPTDVSRRALSIARMIDRLEPGKYTITVIKTDGESDRWQVEIAQPVTIHKKDFHGSAGTAGAATSEVTADNRPVRSAVGS
jgi:hypothetical protein